MRIDSERVLNGTIWLAGLGHGAVEGAGKLTGDLVYGPINNLLGEFNFIAIATRAVSAINRHKPSPGDIIAARKYIGANALGLTLDEETLCGLPTEDSDTLFLSRMRKPR